MKALKIFVLTVVSIVLLLLLYVFAVLPYLTALKSGTPVYLIARYKPIDCGETCVSFYVEQATGPDSEILINQYIYPYKPGTDPESLFAEVNGNSLYCIIGYSHKFYKGYGALFKVGYGGYRIELKDWSTDLSACRIKN